MTMSKHECLKPMMLNGNRSNTYTHDKGFDSIASRRTHELGLQLAIGNITLKEALIAAYNQGVYDITIAVAQKAASDI